MKVKVAEGAGACFGVKRAVEMTQEAAKHGPVYTHGPLIHNDRVNDRLEKSGVKPVNSADEIDEGTLIIRSHGVSPDILAQARGRGLHVIDATCPFVGKAQQMAASLAAENYEVIVVGDRDHPEVAGIVGWAGGKARVVENKEQAEKTPRLAKIGILSQTTQPVEAFYQVVEALLPKSSEIKIFNTICPATRKRQQLTRELAGQVDVMIIVGDRKSANTAKLAAICREAGTPVHLVQGAADLDKTWFSGVESAGVSAGASTPEWIIEEVVTKMNEFTEDKLREDQVAPETAEEKVTEAAPAKVETQTATAAETDDVMGVDNSTEKKEADVEPDSGEITVDTNNTAAEEAADQMNSGLEDSLKLLQEGEIVTGTVIQVNETEALVDVGGKSEGIIPLNELDNRSVANARELVKPGDTIRVCVVKVENKEGHPVLSRKKAVQIEALDTIEAAYDQGQIVEGEVVAVVKGGVIVDIGMRGFLPASLIERGYVSDLAEYTGKKLRCKVIEFDRSKLKAVLSRKAVLEEEREKAQGELWANITEGTTVHGVVSHLAKFGAFIDLGGVDGLLHISEMSWTRINEPSDVLKEGDEVDVVVLGIDAEKKRISLSLKQILPSPWELAATKYAVGDTVSGKVVRTVPFGAFVQLEPGVEGLVHISQLASERIARPEDVVNAGDEVTVKILDIQPDSKRISLSIKEAINDKELAPADAYINTQTPDSGITIGDMFPDGFPGKKDIDQDPESEA